MKKLGLIGGTGPESTIIYYKKLTSGVQKRLGCDIFPHLAIESLSVFKVLDFCERQNMAGLATYLLNGVRNLAAAGAEAAAFTGITPHIVFERVARLSPIPIISMVETACQYAVSRNYRKIALLGTLPTMNGDFFKKPFRKNGIQVIIPTEAEKAYIGEKIASELEFGVVKQATQARLTKIANRLVEQEQADAVVLGCTELPLVFDSVMLAAEKMDVMRIHIDALIETILDDSSLSVHPSTE